MSNVHFYNEVSRTLFKKGNKTRDCLERIPSTNLVEGDEVTSRFSKFQIMLRVQKQQLHERHLQRKKCRLPMREDIIEAFWKIYENQAWERYSKLQRAEETDACVNAATVSVNRNDILKSWREECKMMLPPVEQHHIVPFHDRWVQKQITDKDNIEKMKERLIARSMSLEGFSIVAGCARVGHQKTE